VCAKLWQTFSFGDLFGLMRGNSVVILLFYLVMLNPANILIKALLNLYNLKPTSSATESSVQESLEKAGRFIGSVERLIAITLVLYNQYEAVGFLIAAKSILRLKDGELKTSEYVLIGTLLSFGIAIAMGGLLNKIIGS
jgi:hypothetical protein